MKRYQLALAALLPLMVAGLSFGQTITRNTGYIVGSAHDFGANGFSWAQGEICKPCHTPHSAAGPEVSHAIWSHTMSTATYTVGEETMSVDEALDPYSRLCMSCHDGTVALDSFAGGSATSGPFGSSSKYNVGTDLSNDHPVGNDAKYSDTSSSFNATVLNSRGGKAVGTSVPAQGKGQLPLRKAADGTTDVVSCGTCHNPHGAGNGTTRYPKLLRGTNTNSQLCLTCHIK